MRRPLLLLTLALLLLALLAPAAAPAAVATFTAQTPAPGSVISTLRPTLSVEVQDAAGIRTDSASYLLLDGKTVRARFTLLSGSTRVRLSFTPTTNLAAGAHTVSASVLCWAGQRSTAGWGFTVSGPPTLGNPTPAPASTVADQTPVISAQVTAFAEPSLAATMTVDGLLVPASYDHQSRTVSYTPPTNLTNDVTHAVSLLVSNSVGESAPLSWDFTVQIYPAMPPPSDCRSCHTTYPGAHSQDDCDLCHGYGSPIGGFYGPPDYHPEGEAALLLGDCRGCHGQDYPTVPPLHDPDQGSSHLTPRLSCTTASACHHHQTSLTIEHQRVGGDCLTCHGSSDPVVQGAIAAGDTDCATCHAGKVDGEGNVVAHGGYDQATHTSVETCIGSCHLAEMKPQHDSLGAPFDCSNCHSGLVDSIKPWNKRCAACHTVIEHASAGTRHVGDDASVYTSGTGAQGCADVAGYQIGCHDLENVSVLHGNVLDGGCGVCHNGSTPPTTECRSCHPGTSSDATTALVHHNNPIFMNDPASNPSSPPYPEEPVGGWDDNKFYDYCLTRCHLGYYGGY